MQAKKNIRMTIAYDGGRFLGWQKTKMGPSVEEALQQVLEKILQEEISLQAASRTDAGVHARGQVVNFFTSKKSLELDKLQFSLNSLLPSDIVVRDIFEAPFDFHPTRDCKGKEYHYSLCHAKIQLPHERHYSWHYPYLIDMPSMRSAASHFIGKHNFKSFCNFKKNSNYKDFERTIFQLNIEEMNEQSFRFEITGDHFLYKMVRNIVGTLVYVGRGVIEVDAIPEILQSHHRPSAGITAPAHGLTLYAIEWT